MASLPIVQLRHIATTDAQRQSVTSFALGLDILRKERPLLRLLPQVVTLVKLLCVHPLFLMLRYVLSELTIDIISC